MTASSPVGGLASEGRDAPLAREALAWFDAAAARRDREPAWLAERRREAVALVRDAGLPTVRHEDWRFTNPAPIVRTPFRRARPAPADFDHPLLVEALALVPSPAARLVLVDGVLDRELSHVEAARTGNGEAAPRFSAGSLADALARAPAALEGVLCRHADPRLSGFVALNQALFEDGVLLSLPREASLARPVHVVVVTVGSPERPGEPTASHPRVLVVAEPGSRATVVESHVVLGEGVSLSNVVTEVVCGAGARVDHVRILHAADAALHVATVRAHVGRDATFGSLSLAMGGRLSRIDVDVLLAGEGASCSLDGLYVTRGREHVDHHTRIDHAAPRCTSRELYKGVLDGESTAVFAGRISVRPGAQKTDARQANHTLLLSERATIDTKPELEIFADDVKCAHGATVGQLDEDAMFYLRSRGIGRDTAQAMLVHAFASEVLRRATSAVASERLEEMLADRLPSGPGEDA